jgi:hypothetical protein
VLLSRFVFLLYLLPAIGFLIATAVAQVKMIDAVNRMLPPSQQWSLWTAFLRRQSMVELSSQYSRLYPSGALARRYWVCQGFFLLSGAGAIIGLFITMHE